MNEVALNYIQGKGLQFKQRGNELILRECPFCGDASFHFYLSDGEEGEPFICHKCQEKGNLITLKKHLGDYEQARSPGNGSSKPQGTIKQAFPPKAGPHKTLDEKMALEPHQKLLGDAEGLAYLQGRKISLETVQVFKLGLDLYQGKKWISIPHYFRGKLVNIKYRTLPPAEKEFRRVVGCPSILFNGDCIERFPEIHICEGEIDTLTLWQAGIKNVVGVTCGAGTFDPAWIDQLAKMDQIYLDYDPDEAGQLGAREAARRLGYNRCYNVILPDGQDVNEFFLTHTLSEFNSIAMDSRQFDVAGIIGIEEGFKTLQAEIHRPQRTGLLTPWPNINKKFRRGFLPGELVVVGAPPKIGKSTFCLQIATSNALAGNPSLFYCLEMPSIDVLEKIIQCETKTEIIGPDQIRIAEKAFSEKPLYLGWSRQKPTLDGLIETLRAAIQRYGLKLVIFDHLHFLCRSVTNQVQEIGLAVQAFKFLAVEMEIPVILVAQPRKIVEGQIMTAQDLKDSSSIFSDCDHLIILHRKRKASKAKAVEEGMEMQEEAFDPVTLIRVEASRYNAGGEALLYYHGEYSHFDEVRKEN